MKNSRRKSCIEGNYELKWTLPIGKLGWYEGKEIDHFKMTPSRKSLSVMTRRTITIWGPKRFGTPLPRDVEFTRFGFKTAVWWRNDMRPTTASWTPIRWKCATIVDGDVVRTKRLHSGKDIQNPFITICRTTFERVKAGSKGPLPRQTVF